MKKGTTPGSGKGKIWVVSSKGTRQRFLRGMITHDLVQRGLSFEDGYAAAQTIRDQLGERDEVTTAEIRDLIQEQLARMFGDRVPSHLATPVRSTTELHVDVHGEKQPFSRGVLANSIRAAGVDFDRAYRLVTDLQERMRNEGVTVLPREELARRVGDLLEEEEGVDVAHRYRLVRRLQRLPRPLVIYIGGASGTGKSTLSLELAPLLRIYRINATDTIRQVMRMVFSSTILPALHSSSFELPPGHDGGAGDERSSPHDPEFAQNLVATFEEQATRVCVGVRAVVERAISENMSIIVEGVHLVPPLIPFRDLEGAVYQVPLVLGTLDPEIHRTRFLHRRRGRPAERYVESFAAIRHLHDHLLQQAEAHDVPLIENSSGEVPVTRSLRVVTEMLQRHLPTLVEAGADHEPLPVLLLVIDGLADRPVRALGGRTPLQAARTPVFDRLAREGRCGLADAIAPGVVPDTAAGTLALLGQSPLAMKRGPVEAVGTGMSLAPGDVAMRANLATLDAEGRIVDRRAGRIRDQAAVLAGALDRLPFPTSEENRIEVRVAVGTEHRLAVVLKGEGLSSEIRGSDPGDGAPPGPPLVPAAIEKRDTRAAFTARMLTLFEQEARRVLDVHPLNIERRRGGLPPANAILTRGAGRIHRLVPLEHEAGPLHLTCVSGDRTILGLVSWLGGEASTEQGMTANLDTDLGAKFEQAARAIGRSDLVVLHVKGADVAAHDRRPDEKVRFLEKVDRELGRFLESREDGRAGVGKARNRPFRLAIASDHATLSESGQHAADPIPVLVWGPGIEPDGVERFDEQAVSEGALARFPLQLLLSRLFALT